MATTSAHAAATGGVAVVAADATPAELVWPLAQAVYRSPALLPSKLGDRQARILAGAAVGPEASVAERELGELRLAVRGVDAVSRKVLHGVADSVGARAVAVVWPAAEGAESITVRVYDTSTAAFDPAFFQGRGEAWVASVVTSLGQRFPRENSALPRPAARTAEPSAAAGKPFYRAPVFWVGVGAALLLGGTFFAINRITADDTVAVRVEVPR